MSYEPAEAFQFERVREGGGCKSGGSALIISSYALSTLCALSLRAVPRFRLRFLLAGSLGRVAIPGSAPRQSLRRI